jgi:transcriptional regulator with XRE-family HTH domain
MYTLKIKELRTQRGWSQEDLAMESGISQAEISYIENLDKSPSIHTMIKLATALEACPHDLVKFEHAHNCIWGCND